MLGACATTLKPTPLGKAGYFETDAKIVSDGVKLKEDFKPEYRQMIYVKTDNKNERFNTFYLESFENMGQFEKVLAKEDIESLVFEKNLANKVLNVSDRVGLHNLQKRIGPFLVVEPNVEWLEGYLYRASIKAYDPKTGKEVLMLEHEAFNWAGLDQPLFYPLFNAFLQWARGEEIETTPFSAEKQYSSEYPVH
jgi:hypothetical protein